MASQSYYREWRSQTFGAVVGQGHVTRTLLNALRQDKVAHAYLFCGPRGVGKTSVARILAKAINCKNRSDGEPCDRCAMCVAIKEGHALDVIEIDAASNRRIEEMRDLREKVNFAPSEADYKVYILDEAHMLTPEASNALLKTLEEPPPHTVFMLVTTEAHRILDTIVSRCQRFNFRRIATREIVERLNLVCERAGVSATPEALAVIARAATGSLRDAEGLLDQLVAYCGNEITIEQVRNVLGLSGDEAVLRLAEHVLGGSLAEGLALVNEVTDEGADLARFAGDLVLHLRGLLLLRSGAGTGMLGDVAPDTLAAMRAQSERVTVDQLVKLIRIFAEAEQGTRGGTPQLALELALAEASLLSDRGGQPARPMPERTALARPAPREVPPPVARVVAPAGAEQAPAAPGNRPEAEPEPAAPRGVLRPVARAIAPAGAEQAPAAPGHRPEASPGQGAPLGRGPRVPQEPLSAERVTALAEDLRLRWSDVLEHLGTVNRSLQALLRSCGPYEARGEYIVVGCDAAFHRNKLSEQQNRMVLEKAIAEVLGVLVPVQLEVVPRQQRGQPLPATSDPLVKEVLSWGGRIRAVVPVAESGSTGDRPPAEPAPPDEGENDES